MVVSGRLSAASTDIVYPARAGQHYAILITLEVLRQYLDGQPATVLANQFSYYAQGVSPTAGGTRCDGDLWSGFWGAG